jgi:hypothetical protein
MIDDGNDLQVFQVGLEIILSQKLDWRKKFASQHIRLNIVKTIQNLLQQASYSTFQSLSNPLLIPKKG